MSIRKKMLALAALVAVMGLVILAGSASAASKDNPPSSSVTSSSTFKMTDKSVIVSHGITKGYLEVRWEFPGGWQPKSKKGCIWVTGGTNSYIDAKGRRIWKDWTGKRAFICPDPTSSTGWRKAGGPPKWEPCGNEFIPPFLPKKIKVFTGKIKVVQRFSVTATVKVMATAYGSAQAFAACEIVMPDGTRITASASGFGSGTAIARGSGKATAKTRQAAIKKATGKAMKEVQLRKSGAEADAEAVARAEAWGEASAKVSCTAVPPPNVPPSPPPSPPSPQPPPPAPPPPPTVTYKPWCDGERTDNKSNTEIKWTGGWTSSTDETRTTVTVTIDYPGQYNASVSRTMTVTFPNGNSVSCTATATTGNPPFRP